MNSEKWEQAKHLYQAALKMGRDERPRFLAENSGGDDELLREVESLLSCSDEASGFLEKPAIGEFAASIITERSLSGQKILQYEIVEMLGAGGMGEVYLAEDTRLRRKVALKVLPASLGNDKKSVQRFEQEACAASALNHPNILTVHEFGSYNGMNFIASEFVKGETLRDRLGNGKALKLDETLDIALQVAAALGAAHTSGIVHRDIKPENIMIRDDGLVKVLDFGLAKLISQDRAPGADSETLVRTAPGLIMGTVAYMSPEQARGLETDARTDIWSLGVVIYEMLSGTLPFKGETTGDYIASILRSDPQPLEAAAQDVPFELRSLVRKSLRKDKDSRYQTITGLTADLKDLRNEMSFAEKLERSDGLGRHGPAQAANTRAREVRDTDEKTDAQTGREYLLTGPGPRKRARFVRTSLLVLAILAAVSVAGLFVRLKMGSASLPSDAFQKMQLTKLTYEGLAGFHASISPDGKYIVYVVKEDSKQSLVVRQVASSGTVEIVPPADVSYQGLRFAPDGDNIYYTVSEPNKTPALFQIPVLGGNPRKIADDAGGIPALSPDGKTIAFLNGESSIMLAGADGSSPRLLAAAPPGKVRKQPVWHTDGTSIVASEYDSDAGKDFLSEISVTDASEKDVPAGPWITINAFAWLADGTGIILCGRDPETKLSQLWHIAYPGGERRRITNDLSTYIGVSLTADGKSLITVKQERLSNIWLSGEAAGEAPQRITFEEGRDEGMSGLNQTPDGKIVYTVRSAAATDLWIVNGDGSGNRQLTFNQESNFSPAVSPDGRYIVFISTRTGNNIWRMDIDGGNPTALTNSVELEASPRFTPDGKWIVYERIDAKMQSTVCKISVDGGNPVELGETATGEPEILPDGKSFVAGYEKDEQGDPAKLALYPVEGGKFLKVFDFPAVVHARHYQVAADGKSLIYKENRGRAANLWSQPLDGGPPRQLTFFETGQIYQFKLTHDRKGFIFARGNESSDVIMIGNFR